MSEHIQAITTDRRSVRVLTVTISDTRTPADDESGRCLRDLLGNAGFTLSEHRIVRDEPAALRALLEAVAEQDLADAVISTGGTGIAPRDQTVEALEPLLEKRLDGFGEAFRRLSFDQIGARAILSRAIAGTARGRFVAALPGSPRAVELAVEALLIPVLEHAVALLRPLRAASLSHAQLRSGALSAARERRALASERVALSQAFGRVLAEPLLASASIPAFSYSAMDGYALATADLGAEGPFQLPVLGESRTGRPSQPWVPGTASLISTGAELPQGADAVLPREIVEAEAGTNPRISFQERPRPGQHIRAAGEDLARGAVALAQGTRLGAAALGLAASLDAIELSVRAPPARHHPVPGDELRPLVTVCQADPRFDSLPLATLATLAGADARIAPHVPTSASTERALAAPHRHRSVLTVAESGRRSRLGTPRLERAAWSGFLEVSDQPASRSRSDATPRALRCRAAGQPSERARHVRAVRHAILACVAGGSPAVAEPAATAARRARPTQGGSLEFVGPAGAIRGELTAVPLENQHPERSPLGLGRRSVLVPAEVDGWKRRQRRSAATPGC